MATARTKARKPNTALVFNPSRGLSIGGRKAVRKANPTRRKTATALSNPRHKRRHHKRRRNPGTFSILNNPGGGALVGALFAGVGLSLVDMILARVVPTGSPTIQIITKLGAGFVVQSFGGKVPFIGKYKDGIAFVLYAIAAKEAANYYLLPTVRNTFGQLTSGAVNFINPPAAVPATMAGLQRRNFAY